MSPSITRPPPAPAATTSASCPKAAFAALTATMSKARSSHYEQTLPWDDQGSRMLTVSNYEHYMALLDGLRERMVRERARFIEDYEDNIDQARLDLGKLFRIEDYPSKEALQGKFGIRYRITSPRCRTPTISWRSSPVTTPTGSSATSSTRSRNACTSGSVIAKAGLAVGDLYRRLGEAVERRLGDRRRPSRRRFTSSGERGRTKASRWCSAIP